MIIDQSKSYLVRLTRVVKLGAFTFKPLNEKEMAGSLLAQIIASEGEEAIDYARQL